MTASERLCIYMSLVGEGIGHSFATVPMSDKLERTFKSGGPECNEEVLRQSLLYPSAFAVGLLSSLVGTITVDYMRSKEVRKPCSERQETQN